MKNLVGFISSLTLAFAHAPTVGNCLVLPADNIWNTRVDQLPVSRSSSTWVNTIGPATGVHPDFGAGQWNGGSMGIPFVTVPGTQTKYPATFTYQSESDTGPYAMPLNAPIAKAVVAAPETATQLRSIPATVFSTKFITLFRNRRAGIVGGNAAVGFIACVAVPSAIGSAAVSVANPPSPVSVAISPTNATVRVSRGKQFTATVSNTSNTAVTWKVNGITGGNSTVGTIGTGGLYRAPSSVPSPAAVTVTAVSVADTSKSASAGVTVTKK